MSNVTLRSTIKITKILKTTKAEFFKNLNEGDLVVIKTPFCRYGRNGKSLYATDVELEKISTKETIRKSMTQARNVLTNNFEFEEKE